MLTFVVPGKPVGTNSAYKRGRLGSTGKGFYMTQDARGFKDRLRAYALRATIAAKWKVPTPTQTVAVAIIIWNAKRFDTDSPTKFILDSMQGVVYENDRCVDKVSIARSFDDGEVRVEVSVSLLERAARASRSPAKTDACAEVVTRRRPATAAAPSSDGP